MTGPPGPEQVEATLHWVTQQFRQHYERQADVWVPPRMTRREYGFLWNGRKFFLRHVGMSSADALHDFLAREGPHHCYYSTAYYDTPHASTMKDKMWRGADLVFDLDADHLSDEAKEWPLEKQLAAIKAEGRKLLDEYILGDFGFAPEHVRIVFSGGRGYHFHVSDPRVWSMDAHARREIVDYVTANGLSPGDFVEVLGPRVTIPKPDEPAWRGRFARGVLGHIESILAEPDAEHMVQRAKVLGIKGLGPKTMQAVRLATVKDAGGSSQWERFSETGTTKHPALAKLVKAPALGVTGLNNEAGETDEPVTADVKRLIRLPGSLHGKTGLRAQEVPMEAFDAFEPLRDACPWGEELVDVVVSKPERVRLAGVEYACEPGPQALPLRYAMFLTLRRKALQPAPPERRVESEQESEEGVVK